MKFKLFTILTALFFAGGCNNEIELNAPYKDIAVVYGFLDPFEPLQVIRVQKAFQNSAGVTVDDAAKNADSLYFDTLVVSLKNTTSGNVITCTKIDTIKKEDGFFGSQKNISYVTNVPISSGTYELNIFNPKTGNTYKGRTNVVSGAQIEARSIFLTTNPNTYIPFRFTQGQNAYIHDCAIRFTYTEVDINDPNIREDKYLDYFIAKNQELSTPGSFIDLRVQSIELISFWKSQIKPDNTKKRYSKDISFIVYGGGMEFKVLLDLAKPNTSIVQKKPEFSNIEGGLGIFTSRAKVATGPNVVTLSSSSKDLLVQELPNFTR